jgi:chromate transporter
MQETATRDSRVKELAWVFLKLGTISFGGPAAHIALMQEEIVKRRRWISEQEFLDLLGATNLIPGPNSTELAIHIGHKRGGWAGLVVAGLCFILPAAMSVTVLAWLYVTHGSRPEAEGLLFSIKPAIVSVVIQALFRLFSTAVRTRGLLVLAIASILAVAGGVNEVIVLVAAGAVWMLLTHPPRKDKFGFAVCSGIPILLLQVAVPAAVKPFGLPAMFLFFVKVGSILFGSGYVLLAFLRADLVERWRWLTETQLLDAIAIGQVTPGPVFTTATFIGYVLGGGPGAFFATLGIFLPAFFFVAASGPLVPRLRKSDSAGAFLDGVNVASLALMTVVTWQLGHAAIVDSYSLAIAVLSAVALLWLRVSPASLVAISALVGLIVSTIAK